jgi:hypothetical protein
VHVKQVCGNFDHQGTPISLELAGKTFEALRLLWTVAYLGRRFLRADSQHNAATVEQARVESGYDEEVILLHRTR